MPTAAAARRRRAEDGAEYHKRIQSSLSSIATLVTIILQGGVAIWWASSVSSELAFLRESARRVDVQVSILQGSRYSADEEKSYRQSVHERLVRLEDRK